MIAFMSNILVGSEIKNAVTSAIAMWEETVLNKTYFNEIQD
jgi:hypothetical protein